MRYYANNKFRIDIFSDQTFISGSAENNYQYDLEHLDKKTELFSTVFGIKLFEGRKLLKSAVIGSVGGATVLHKTSTIIDNDRILICCADSVFCIAIPDLSLLWQKQVDAATCFQIFKYQDSYIIHGELCISRIDKEGKILWQRGGKGVFATVDGKEDFLITENYIWATDWEHRKYIFDFDGQQIL